ncbi:GNAT family N-acetyltransferase [Rossellomorea vietnamensis]|uniref:GNAT family N-acetyltransferase n=1 Tax=Rossellomorea vietnamensis TaxID=218284 RepID=A0A5D4KAD6_9BACI|nr:GNAT family N-acetyltransferase [Rossellomorea vietnamensis]TYR73976.1 GNAT family N-acetyltransferase [Rossellomorea vietnamensis]
METFTYLNETDRLIVRPLIQEDYSAWLKGFNDRLPSHYRHDQGKMDMEECTVSWFASLVEKHQSLAKNDTAYVFGVFRKTDGKHLGMIDFSTLTREDFQWGRIGYTLHNQFWGKGFGKEAVKAALDMAFSDLKYHRVEAHINLDNHNSIRLAESVGMDFECVRKGYIYEFGEWTDNVIYFKNA